MVTPARVLVIVPTHDHASTLDLAVGSALAQTVHDLDIVVIGDGVGDDTRAVVRSLMAQDHRVRFLDRPKSASRAESTRHEVIMESGAEIVTYLGDDDLFFPDHAATMLSLLAGHDFAHPYPVFVNADEEVDAMAVDLGDPRWAAWHLLPHGNAIGLTGASHTVSFYRSLPQGWTEPPADVWSDHHLWQQIFRQPGVRLTTADRSTVVKPPAYLRVSMTRAQRRASLERWSERIADPAFEVTWSQMCSEATRRLATDTFFAASGESQRLAEVRSEADAMRGELDVARAESSRHAETLNLRQAEIARLQSELSAVQATRTWRSRSVLVRFAALRRLFARTPH